MSDEPAHSPLGASSAERWMNCPGSISLLKQLNLPDTDEPDYRREGIALHEAAAHCLAAGVDTWEIVGSEFHETIMDAAMCDAIQVYLDRVRPSINGFHGTNFFIESRLARPEVHPSMFGTVDFGALVPDTIDRPVELRGFLDVTDLKGGVGIIVEPDDNPQMKYYAFMLLDQHFADQADALPVRLTIVQPRAFHQQGVVREWWTTAGEIRQWVKDTLVPAMFDVETNGSLDAGAWCRFCPAKLVCPLLTSLFGAAAKSDPKIVVNISDASLGRSYQYTEGVKFYLKALEEEAYRRLNLGTKIEGIKLVNKKANRVFNSSATLAGAETIISDVVFATFGDDGFTPPKLKTPAELEKVSPAARAFVKEHAYTPQTGLTVALASDTRQAVKVDKASEVFADAIKNLPEGK